mmetsp:Transcript_30798/g.51526  ORF Transcript_30798/g.51526 Transcript_30798/m.51526 type:complete len:128 (-) Transcript_30798:329-712(-)
MDVLDDLSGEAQEVTEVNPWIHYGDPLQKLREFGASVKEMDLIDESPLSSEQMRVMCSILVSTGEIKSIPHPDEDWALFLSVLKEKNDAEALIFDPLTKTMKPWINIAKLQQVYGKGHAGSTSCTIS